MRRAGAEECVQRDEDRRHAAVGDDLHPASGTLASGRTVCRFGEAGLFSVPDFGHQYTEKEERDQEPEEYRPWVKHVNECYQNGHDDASRGELVLSQGKGDQTDGCGDLAGVILGESRDIHDRSLSRYAYQLCGCTVCRSKLEDVSGLSFSEDPQVCKSPWRSSPRTCHFCVFRSTHRDCTLNRSVVTRNCCVFRTLHALLKVRSC